jgi:MYXO-CTERM domain-containing protein
LCKHRQHRKSRFWPQRQPQAVISSEAGVVKRAPAPHVIVEDTRISGSLTRVKRLQLSLGAFFLSLGVSTAAWAGGAGGGSMLPTCVDDMDACQVCAGEECFTEAQACCDAQGCQDLVLCVLDNCASPTDIQCAFANCQAELNAAGGIQGPGTQAAQGLGQCLGGPLQNPPPGACTDCVNGFGAGGAGTTSVGAGGNGTTATTTTSTGAGGEGPSTTTGAGAAGGASSSTSGAGGGNGNDLVIDDGCGCRVTGSPTESLAPWMLGLGLAGLWVSRRRSGR